MKHLVSIDDLTRESASELLDNAERLRTALEGRTVRKLPGLRGRMIMTVFYENSTRTRTSFETAAKLLSADTASIAAASSSVKKGESLRDTMQTLRAIGADALVIRHPASGAPAQVARWMSPDGVSGPSVINAGDGTHEHPTQALLDALTMRQRLGQVDGLRVVICGDIVHSRVARSDVKLMNLLGAEVVLVAPPTLLPVGVETWPVTVSNNLDSELPSADVVMMLRVQEERMTGGFFPSPREYSALYGLDSRRGALMQDHAIIMHPGPILRGMEIGDAVADSPASAILQQVNNGVYARMAVLFTLLSGSLE